MNQRKLYEKNFSVRDVDNLLFVKVSLTPEKSLSEFKANFVRAKVLPTESGLKLPAWVDAWSVTVDGSAKNFDGARTVNLSRIFCSLKDSVFAASRPALTEINFVGCVEKDNMTNCRQTPAAKDGGRSADVFAGCKSRRRTRS